MMHTSAETHTKAVMVPPTMGPTFVRFSDGRCAEVLVGSRAAVGDVEREADEEGEVVVEPVVEDTVFALPCVGSMLTVPVTVNQKARVRFRNLSTRRAFA